MVKPFEYGRWDIVSEHANERGWTMGAELGVLRGLLFFRILDRCPKVTLVGVDIWEPRPEQDAIRSDGGRSYKEHDLGGYEREVRKSAAQYGNRAIIHKMRTTEAAKLYDDETFDFVFLDADHTYEGVRADIAAWWPKVKIDGMLMGHDFQHGFPGVIRAVTERWPHPQTFSDNVWAVQRA